jgi:hypothetical protein
VVRGCNSCEEEERIARKRRGFEEEEKMREEERIEEDKGRARKTRCLFCCQQSKSRVHRTTVATLLFWHRFHVVHNRQRLPKSEMVTVCQRKIWNNCGDFGLMLFTCSDYGTTVGHLFSKSKKSKLPPIFDQVLASTSRGLSFVRYELLASGTKAFPRNNRTAPTIGQ